MADPTTEFEHQLETFRVEAEAATRFFYAYLSIHAVAGEHKSVYGLLNGSALFWNTALAQSGHPRHAKKTPPKRGGLKLLPCYVKWCPVAWQPVALCLVAPQTTSMRFA